MNPTSFPLAWDADHKIFMEQWMTYQHDQKHDNISKVIVPETQASAWS
jgi:hypothetical protein